MCSAVWRCPTFCHLAPLRLRACLYDAWFCAPGQVAGGPGSAAPAPPSAGARRLAPAIDGRPSSFHRHQIPMGHTYKLCSVLRFIGAGVVRGGSTSRGVAMRITSKNNKSKDSALLCSALLSTRCLWLWQAPESLPLSCSQDVWCNTVSACDFQLYEQAHAVLRFYSRSHGFRVPNISFYWERYYTNVLVSKKYTSKNGFLSRPVSSGGWQAESSLKIVFFRGALACRPHLEMEAFIQVARNQSVS